MSIYDDSDDESTESKGSDGETVEMPSADEIGGSEEETTDTAESTSTGDTETDDDQKDGSIIPIAVMVGVAVFAFLFGGDDGNGRMNTGPR